MPTEPATATRAASDDGAEMVRRRTPMKRITAASRRRSSTLSSMMQRRKIALATIVITPMARWKRLTTWKVCEDSRRSSWSPTPGSRTHCSPARRPRVHRCARNKADAERLQPDHRHRRASPYWEASSCAAWAFAIWADRARLVHRADDDERAYWKNPLGKRQRQGVADARRASSSARRLDGHGGSGAAARVGHMLA